MMMKKLKRRKELVERRRLRDNRSMRMNMTLRRMKVSEMKEALLVLGKEKAETMMMKTMMNTAKMTMMWRWMKRI